MKATVIADYVDRLNALHDDLEQIEKDIEYITGLAKEAGIGTRKLHSIRYLTNKCTYDEILSILTKLSDDELNKLLQVDKDDIW